MRVEESRDIRRGRQESLSFTFPLCQTKNKTQKVSSIPHFIPKPRNSQAFSILFLTL